jgi:hypothetical protein
MKAEFFRCPGGDVFLPDLFSLELMDVHWVVVPDLNHHGWIAAVIADHTVCDLN